jgi:hypothetical protein
VDTEFARIALGKNRAKMSLNGDAESSGFEE